MKEIRELATDRNVQPLADKLRLVGNSKDHAYRILQAMLTSPMMFDSTLWGTPLVSTHLRNIGMEKPFINKQGHYLSYWYWVKPIAVYMRSIMQCDCTSVPAFEWTDKTRRINATGFKNPYRDLGDIWTNAAPITARPVGAPAREQQYPYITYELEKEETERFFTQMEHTGTGTYEGRHLIEDGDPEDILNEEARDIDVAFGADDYLGNDTDHETYDQNIRVINLMLYETADRVHDLDGACPMDTADVQEFIDDILEEGNEDWLV